MVFVKNAAVALLNYVGDPDIVNLETEALASL